MILRKCRSQWIHYFGDRFWYYSRILCCFTKADRKRSSTDRDPRLGTFIAGVLFNAYRPVWVDPPVITGGVVLSISTVILLGTIIPFGLLLYSSRFAPSDVISIMDALQPATTAVLSVIFLGLGMNWVEVVGIVLVIVAIYILQRGRKNMEQVGYREEDF